MLTRDLLVMRGHTQIRIMDGPGDGGRDIYSLDANANAHVTQGTHAGRPSKTIGSRKLAELPIALLKFGAKRGLFVTSGRISPQAKRECVGDYRQFTLDFLDGDGVADEILRHIPLKAVWFDGIEFGRVSNCIRIPFLLRDLDKDRSIVLSSAQLNGRWPSSSEQLQVHCRQESMHASVFTPYRQPESPVLFEGSSSALRAHEWTLSGPTNLGGLGDVCAQLAQQALRRVRRLSDSRLIAIRVGQPVLVPLKGEWAGANIHVGPPASTLIRDGDSIVEERMWLAEVDDDWLPTREIRAMTADWQRLYNPTLDICFRVEHVTTLSEEARLQTSAVTRMVKRDWERSAFVLMPTDRDRELDELDLPPSERYRWADGRLFAVWSFRSYAGPFMSITVEDGDSSLFHEEEKTITVAIDRVREWARKRGYELVKARAARYMRAYLAGDPFPTDQMLYRFVDIICNEPMPSPLDPRGRLLRLDVCWRLPSVPDDGARGIIEKCLDSWESACAVDDRSYCYEFDEASETAAGKHWFMRLELTETDGDVLASTNHRLKRFVAQALPKFRHLEEEFRAAGVTAVRATRAYWSEICFVEFAERAKVGRRQRDRDRRNSKQGLPIG